MNTKPILFNTEMIRALLDGRKTQTRRLLPEWQRPKKDDGEYWNWVAVAQRHSRYGFIVSGQTESECMANLERSVHPYGKPGDLLWVREHWGYHGSCTSGSGNEETNTVFVNYHADGQKKDICFDSFEEMYEATPDQNIKYPEGFADLDEWDQGVIRNDLLDKWWKQKKSIPSIHMPRWASRLTLRITNVRVERVQDISEDDAAAEGIFVNKHDIWSWNDDSAIGGASACDAFYTLWNSINGPDAWDRNDWVWVIEFEVVKQNVDEVLR